MGLYDGNLTSNWTSGLRNLPEWMECNVSVSPEFFFEPTSVAPALSGTHTEPTANKIPLSWYYNHTSSTSSTSNYQKLIECFNKPFVDILEYVDKAKENVTLGYDLSERNYLWIQKLDNNSTVTSLEVQYSDNSWKTLTKFFSIEALLNSIIPGYFQERDTLFIGNLNFVHQSSVIVGEDHFVDSYYYSDERAIWVEHPINKKKLLVTQSNLKNRYIPFASPSPLKYFIENVDVKTTLAAVNTRINASLVGTCSLRELTNSSDEYKYLQLNPLLLKDDRVSLLGNFKRGSNKSLYFNIGLLIGDNQFVKSTINFGVVNSFPGERIYSRWFNNNVYVNDQIDKLSDGSILPSFNLLENKIINVEANYTFYSDIIFQGKALKKSQSQNKNVALTYYCRPLVEEGSLVQLQNSLFPELSLEVIRTSKVNIQLKKSIGVSLWGNKNKDFYISYN